MGMFDQIRAPDINCPECGIAILNEVWQSKDGPCEMETLDFWEVDNFYHICDGCDAWIQFTRKIKRERLPLTAYEMTSRPRKIAIKP